MSDFDDHFRCLCAAYAAQNLNAVCLLCQTIQSRYADEVDTIVRCGADSRKITSRYELQHALFFEDWVVVSVYRQALLQSAKFGVRDVPDLAQDVSINLIRYFRTPRPSFESAINLQRYVGKCVRNQLLRAFKAQRKRDQIGSYSGLEDQIIFSGLNAKSLRVRSKTGLRFHYR